MGAVCLVLLVVVGGVADAVNMVLFVLMRGGAVTDFASFGGCCDVRGNSVVGGAANILYFLFNLSQLVLCFIQWIIKTK